MDFASPVDQFLDAYGLAAIVAIMLLKEIGVPIPIPADLIMLGAAARTAQGRFSLGAVFLALLIPACLGGLVQYAFAKGPGRRVIYRVGAWIGLTKERLDRAMERVRRGGAVAVSIGLTTPGIRIAIVPASGLANLSLGAFIPGLIAGSAFFIAWHFAIGYAGGALIGAFTNAATLPIMIGLALFALSGFAGWMILRRRARAATRERVGDWIDASCPVCVAIGAAEHVRNSKNQVSSLREGNDEPQ